MRIGISLQWIGRIIALGAVGAAVVMAAIALNRLDERPRTHDAFLYADSIGLAPDVSGRIVALRVAENQRVREGETLVEIDPEPFELRLREARAQAAALRAQIDLTTRQVAAQSSGADAAETQIGRARSQLALAQDTVGRLTPLLGKGYVTVQQIDEARTNVKVAQATLTTAIQQAQQARQAVGDTASLQAQLAGAQAAVAMAERDLRNTSLRAPFDGKVVGLTIAAGAYATTGRPLFTLIKTRDLVRGWQFPRDGTACHQHRRSGHCVDDVGQQSSAARSCREPRLGRAGQRQRRADRHWQPRAAERPTDVGLGRGRSAFSGQGQAG